MIRYQREGRNANQYDSLMTVKNSAGAMKVTELTIPREKVYHSFVKAKAYHIKIIL